jgi:hypothetical protein
VIARVVSVALAITLVACTHEYADPVTTSDVLTEMSICPDVAPMVGDECVAHIDPSNGNSLAPRCEYGSNADLGCNFEVGCTITSGAAWQMIPEDVSLACAMNQCPHARADITEGASCDAPVDKFGALMSEYVCGYAEGTCGCMAGATGFVWKCVPPPPDPCPSTRPKIGRYCDQDDLACDYGACTFEHSAAMVCSGKRWHLAAASCN